MYVWARDETDDQVKGFLVTKGTDGFARTKMAHKIALRAVQDADITLVDVAVPESRRLQKEARRTAHQRGGGSGYLYCNNTGGTIVQASLNGTGAKTIANTIQGAPFGLAVGR